MYLTNFFAPLASLRRMSLALSAFILVLLAGCDSSSDSSDESSGSLRFYNLSSNAPAIYLTIDEDLSDDDDDAFEKTYTGVNFNELSASTDLESGDYFYEMAFQNEDSAYRDDLEIIVEGEVSIENNSTLLMVLDNSVNSPNVSTYYIPVIDDDGDDDNDLFNLRVLNMFSGDAAPSIYLSKEDETFNEAVLFGEFTYQELSDNQKFDQDTYIFYLADPVSNDVVYQSDEVSFLYASQYVMVIRENTATGDSPYLLDKISNSAKVEYIDVHTESKIRAFNAIQTHELLPDYTGEILMNLSDINNSTMSEVFSFGEFSESLIQENGDYSFDLIISDTNTNLITNHLLTLPDNSDKTIFFYLEETNVDDDNDGDFDEDNDGNIDEIEVNINSLVVDNSNSESIYDHQITLINLINSDDFGFVRFYFVRNNELISTTPYNKLVSYAQPLYTALLNNTYEVYVVAQDGSSEVILHSFELTLNEASSDSFIIIQNDSATASGYRVSIEAQ